MVGSGAISTYVENYLVFFILCFANLFYSQISAVLLVFHAYCR